MCHNQSVLMSSCSKLPMFSLMIQKTAHQIIFYRLGKNSKFEIQDNDNVFKNDDIKYFVTCSILYILQPAHVQKAYKKEVEFIQLIFYQTIPRSLKNNKAELTTMPTNQYKLSSTNYTQTIPFNYFVLNNIMSYLNLQK